jgi:serine/threonine-protein kinase
MEASSGSGGSKVAGGVVADVPVEHGELEQSTTTASLVSDSDHRKRRSGRFALAAAVTIVLLVGAAAGLQLHARRPTATTVSAGPLQPPPTIASAPLGATPPSAPPSPVAALPSAPPSTPAPSAARAGSRPPPATPRPPSINCNPPYTIDANGTRHWKNGC